uniref:Uncharacterized protein n=1 Tax=Ralstonia solanacearum TaxID=305 RepID=A0A0S4XBJ8_RALSL|nr:conserved protein of unknown function [Ralstonia solanacearum]CUV35390.1 conserved protein of unknown function [Ralstonia solanacearum]CUV40867.1 conserved protein of unknown function [Ralstonia solanacearum]CUV61206.1 conserved protein of unknown function [Ralstonia solanacearum]
MREANYGPATHRASTGTTSNDGVLAHDGHACGAAAGASGYLRDGAVEEQRWHGPPTAWRLAPHRLHSWQFSIFLNCRSAKHDPKVSPAVCMAQRIQRKGGCRGASGLCCTG